MKRKTIILCLLLFILLSALAVVSGHFLFRKPPITEEAYDRIKEGMTKEEVEAILGRPNGTVVRNLRQFDYWRGTGEDEGTINVFYDGKETVHYKWFGHYRDPSLIERAKDWLGLK